MCSLICLSSYIHLQTFFLSLPQSAGVRSCVRVCVRYLSLIEVWTQSQLRWLRQEQPTELQAPSAAANEAPCRPRFHPRLWLCRVSALQNVCRFLCLHNGGRRPYKRNVTASRPSCQDKSTSEKKQIRMAPGLFYLWFISCGLNHWQSAELFQCVIAQSTSLCLRTICRHESGLHCHILPSARLTQRTI